MEDIETDNLEIVIRDDGKVVWINTEKCVFRAYITGKLTVDDRRVKSKPESRKERLEHFLWNEGFTLDQCYKYAKRIDKLLDKWNKVK